ncbi:MAG TPA: hypothetical protein VJA25_14855, partial [Dehalococcoidia bacterium]|nr:hypothetical protein [Dehalococcoidia bacterium]
MTRVLEVPCHEMSGRLKQWKNAGVPGLKVVPALAILTLAFAYAATAPGASPPKRLAASDKSATAKAAKPAGTL